MYIVQLFTSLMELFGLHIASKPIGESIIYIYINIYIYNFFEDGIHIYIYIIYICISHHHHFFQFYKLHPVFVLSS